MLQLDRKAEVAVYLGKRGSGKSSLARARIRESERVVIYDTLEEYPAPVIISNPRELLEYLQGRQKFKVAYRPFRPEKEFGWVCRVLFNIGNLLFVAEEVDQYSSAHGADVWFNNLLRRGRHRQVEMICISRRPAEIPRDLTANVYRMVAFRTSEPRDVDYFRRVMGDMAHALRNLPELTGIEWRDTGEMRVIRVDPARECFSVLVDPLESLEQVKNLPVAKAIRRGNLLKNGRKREKNT